MTASGPATGPARFRDETKPFRFRSIHAAKGAPRQALPALAPLNLTYLP